MAAQRQITLKADPGRDDLLGRSGRRQNCDCLKQPGEERHYVHGRERACICDRELVPGYVKVFRD